jgi:DNA-binding HxlR family transcriptional regulator
MAHGEEATETCRSADVGVVREFMSKIGDKWGMLLVVTLARTPTKRARFSELQRMLDPISQRVLTSTLRDLERDGFLSRKVFAEVPPRVEYELTALGLDMLDPLERLVQWIGANWPSIEQSRASFDERRGAAPPR